MTEQAPANTPAPAPAASPKLNQFMGNPAPASAKYGESPEDLLLNNPKGFIEKIKQDVRQEIGAIEGQKNRTKEFYDSFYKSNPDLKDLDWQVQSVIGEKISEWKDLSPEEGAKKLAEETRRRVDLIRKTTGVRQEELKTTPAGTLPASGDSITGVPTPAAPTKNFVQEIQDMRAKKRRKA